MASTVEAPTCAVSRALSADSKHARAAERHRKKERGVLVRDSGCWILGAGGVDGHCLCCNGRCSDGEGVRRGSPWRRKAWERRRSCSSTDGVAEFSPETLNGGKR
uniref:Uncharacterized protein n=1 Tax=Kalanchoe fedtschenkoi TaxID=63787 RepID=A0A7N0UZ14_KALFE